MIPSTLDQKIILSWIDYDNVSREVRIYRKLIIIVSHVKVPAPERSHLAAFLGAFGKMSAIDQWQAFPFVPHPSSVPIFILLLFALHAFTRLPRYEEGNIC